MKKARQEVSNEYSNSHWYQTPSPFAQGQRRKKRC